MCKFKFHVLVALLTFGVGVLVIGTWCGLSVSPNPIETNNIQPATDQPAQQSKIEDDPFLPKKRFFLNCNAQQNRITYRGISFDCNSQLGSKIEVAEFSKSSLQSEDHKPDYVHPSYIAFSFDKKEDKGSEGEYIYGNRLSIYPVEEYGRMYSLTGAYNQGFDENIKSLKTTLSTKQAHRNTYARLLAATDGSFGFKSHLKYISFKNGKGVGFVTQIQMEVTIINNEELAWVFEGITDDGKYYVRVIFPIQASILPKTSADKFEGYSTDDYANLSERNEQYIALVKKKLDAFPTNQYQPNLENIVNLISSLEVK